MYVGLFTIHPLSYPLSNEISYTLTGGIQQGMMVYSSVIRPEIVQLKKIIKLL